MKAWFWAAASGAFVLAACATGPEPGHGDDHAAVRALLSVDALMFESFDTNGDLQITNDEIEAGIAREFARADSNHDGSIQPLEFTAWSNTVLGGGETAPYRLDFDHDVNNIITRQEFHDEIVARAHQYDANEDGVLTRNEFVREVGAARRPQGPGMHPSIEGRRSGPGGN